MTLRFGTALFAVLLASAPAAAETLLVERVQQENHAAMPARGMSMAQVQARFGAPSDRLDPRGGQKRAWPSSRSVHASRPGSRPPSRCAYNPVRRVRHARDVRIHA